MALQTSNKKRPKMLDGAEANRKPRSAADADADTGGLMGEVLAQAAARNSALVRATDQDITNNVRAAGEGASGRRPKKVRNDSTKLA